MADHVQGATKGIWRKAEGVTNGALSKIEGGRNWFAANGKAILDSIVPPEKRSTLLAKLQAFMSKNPKLSAFLGINFAITGVPLFLFILFSLAGFTFALLVGLVTGLLGAVTFTLFMVGTALFVVLPTLFFTTFAATSLFLWGLGGYYILRWASGDQNKERSDDAPAVPIIGDSTNSLAGDRLTDFMDVAKTLQSAGNDKGCGDHFTAVKADGIAPSVEKVGTTVDTAHGASSRITSMWGADAVASTAGEIKVA